jgi:hypothetical protein
MSRLWIAVLLVSLVANVIGAVVVYKYWKLKGWFNEAQTQLSEANAALKSLHQSVNSLTGRVDKQAERRVIFLHHSVGEGILTAGGLRDMMLRDLGLLVKSATYGDGIGEQTDMNHWVAKFSDRMDDILSFSHHPDNYNLDGTVNDVVMFKSCFPNSDIMAEGSGPGEPESQEKTLVNYKATWQGLKAEMAKQPDRLFVYLTAPPLIPELSSAGNAARARGFNNWLKAEFLPQYREETGLDNLVIFGLFDVLAGEDNYLKTEYRRALPDDPHPNAEGSRVAATEFMSFFQPIWEEWEAGRTSS